MKDKFQRQCIVNACWCNFWKLCLFRTPQTLQKGLFTVPWNVFVKTFHAYFSNLMPLYFKLHINLILVILPLYFFLPWKPTRARASPAHESSRASDFWRKGNVGGGRRLRWKRHLPLAHSRKKGWVTQCLRTQAWRHASLVWIPAWPLTGREATSLPTSWTPNLGNGDNNHTDRIGLLWRLNVLHNKIMNS